MTILHIDTSISGENSVSRTIKQGGAVVESPQPTAAAYRSLSG
jgi:hypothetical protein